MILELHVWGPAFTLPSIDPRCLAAIAYLTHVVPRGQWVLIAGDGLALSQTKELPSLRHGSTWISGFSSIVDYLRQFEKGWDLDIGLSRDARADCIAFSSLVEANGRSLLDLSLLVSSKNYEAVTRPLYSAILPWPIQYFTPPKLRSAAKTRTEHLGLSALDIDAPNEKGTSQASASTATLAAHIPHSLRRPKETVTTVLTQPLHASQFRLDALMTSVLEPLQELLGEKRFFFSDKQISSLDCLVLGYLALFLYPDLPQSWLADTMRSKYAKLCGYVDDLRGRFLGCPITIHDFRIANQEASLQGRGGNKTLHYTVLPWGTPGNRGFSQVGNLLLENIADSLPLVQHLPRSNRPNGTTGGDRVKDPNSGDNGNAPRQALNSQALAITAGVSAALGYLLYAGLSRGETQKASLRDLGEAGAILSGIGGYNAITKEQPLPPRSNSSSG
ncbi:MAG: hypothetical protein M1839_006989 [Geoglossum umbratile]|nr:MAG: hypothetical protein M1839_006989 [Geoglossum umbratile]